MKIGNATILNNDVFKECLLRNVKANKKQFYHKKLTDEMIYSIKSEQDWKSLLEQNPDLPKFIPLKIFLKTGYWEDFVNKLQMKSRGVCEITFLQEPLFPMITNGNANLFKVKPIDVRMIGPSARHALNTAKTKIRRYRDDKAMERKKNRLKRRSV
jgi:hypothetical protein